MSKRKKHMVMHLKTYMPIVILLAVCSLLTIAFTKGEDKRYERTYYEDGTLASEGWKRYNVKTDYWIFYHPNGKISMKGFYAYGKKEQYWYYYDEHRVRSKEGRYHNDQQEGWWLYYDKKGRVAHKCQLSQGLKNGYCLKYEDAKMISAEQYNMGNKIREWQSFDAFTDTNSLSNIE
ncbi:toxin-antitoxin system YwqK family antitoxin [Maribacter sedimenticola]|nr:hypothetical protein [Maribacter sedimenticola]